MSPQELWEEKSPSSPPRQGAAVSSTSVQTARDPNRVANWHPAVQGSLREVTKLERTFNAPNHEEAASGWFFDLTVDSFYYDSWEARSSPQTFIAKINYRKQRLSWAPVACLVHAEIMCNLAMLVFTHTPSHVFSDQLPLNYFNRWMVDQPHVSRDPVAHPPEQ